MSICEVCSQDHVGKAVKAGTEHIPVRKPNCPHCGQANWHWGDPLPGASGFQRYDNVSGDVHSCEIVSKAAPTPTVVGGSVDLAPVYKRIEGVVEAIEFDGKRIETLQDQQRALAASFDTVEQNTEAVRNGLAAVRDEMSRLQTAQPLVINLPGRVDAINVGRQHPTFTKLLAYLASGVNVWLRGPAGSGKTTAVEMAAKALDLFFAAMSVGPQTSKSDIFGYMSGAGTYVRSLTREVYEFGGIMLYDEADAANAGVWTSINGLTANNEVGFPDGMVRKHPDCYFVAAGNTYGRGADALYVGRTQLDAATLDRFATLEWDYDWNFVSELSGDSTWTTYVAKCSEVASSLKLRVVIGPRAAINGAKLLRGGVDRADVEYALLWSRMDTDAANKIKANL